MGAGIAVEFRRRWPAMYEAYRLECREGRFKPGGVFMWDADGMTIFNLATQPYPGPSAQLEYIRTAVEEAVRVAQAKSIRAIGMPRIGAGLGGLEWEAVRGLLTSIAHESDVLLAVYELPRKGLGVT